MNRIMGDYELYHTAKKQHKYIKKIGNRYFYTMEELRSYSQGNKTAADSASSKPQMSTISKLKEGASNLTKKKSPEPTTPTQEKIQKAKEVVDKMAKQHRRNKAKRKVKKYMNAPVKSLKKQTNKAKAWYMRKQGKGSSNNYPKIKSQI